MSFRERIEASCDELLDQRVTYGDCCSQASRSRFLAFCSDYAWLTSGANRFKNRFSHSRTHAHNFITGPPTHSVGASIVLQSGVVCRRRLSSSVISGVRA